MRRRSAAPGDASAPSRPATTPPLPRLRRALAAVYERVAPGLFDDADADPADRAIRALEPAAVLLCVALISWGVVLYSARVTPEVFRVLGAFPLGLAHTALGVALVASFGRSYYRLLSVPPGTTRAVGRARLVQAAKEAEAAADDDDPAASSFHPRWTHCDHCDLPKPPLAHHCSTCRACVLRADHHCPWFAGCLGYGNYRHFVLFCVYLSVAGAYACATTYALFADRASRDPWGHRWLVALALASGGVSVALGVLLAWHFSCLRTGLGTLEMMDRVFGWHEEEEDEGEEEQAGGKAAAVPGAQPRPRRRPRPPHVAVASLRDYPWNLGLEGNVRLAFDLDDGRGGWWWRWLAVHGAPRKGEGFALPTQPTRRRRGD